MANLYVSNPRHKKKSRRSSKRRASTKARSSTRRRNSGRPAAARRARRSAKRTTRRASTRRMARRSIAMRNPRGGTRRRARTRVIRRRRSTGKTYTARRRNGAGARRRRSSMRVRHIIVRRTRNGLELSNPAGGIRGMFGGIVSLLPLVLMGGLGVEIVGQAGKMVAGLEFVQEYTPEIVKEYAPRVAYTLGGLVIGALIQALTFIPAQYRHGMGIAMAAAGGGVDWYRYRSESGAYGDLSLGDGGNWKVIDDDGDGGDLGALELGALELGDYAGDEDYCGTDFTPEEGQAIANGRMLHRFPHRKGQKTRGVEGHRWRWAAQRYGVDSLKDVARLPPAARQRMIHAMKNDARAARGLGPIDATPVRQIAERLNIPQEMPREREAIPFESNAGAF